MRLQSYSLLAVPLSIAPSNGHDGSQKNRPRPTDTPPRQPHAAVVRVLISPRQATAAATETTVTIPNGSALSAPPIPTSGAATPPKAKRANPSRDDAVPA